MRLGAESRRNRLNMYCEVVAVLEVELVLAALFRWAGGHITLRLRITQDRDAELLVDKNSGSLFGNASGDRGKEAVVDDAFRCGDLGRLFGSQSAGPAEHLGFKRPAMVERQNIQGSVEAKRHGSAFRNEESPRHKEMSVVATDSLLRFEIALP